MNITLNIPQEAQNLLFAFAKEKNTTQENLIKNAVLNFLEDLQDAKLADDAYKEYLQSGEKSTPADEVFKKLGV